MAQSRWKDKFWKQNKLTKSANFVSKFRAKHAIEEQSQCLDETVLYAAKAIYIPPNFSYQSEIVTKSSENSVIGSFTKSSYIFIKSCN